MYQYRLTVTAHKYGVLYTIDDKLYDPTNECTFDPKHTINEPWIKGM
jgi:predicted nucleic acid-binding Zn ribbon protein